MPLVPGTKVGPYEVTAPLGAGGMGEVYRATDTNLKRAVALKVLPATVASDPDRLARFQREAEVLASLNHPHIAAVYGLERGEGHTAIVMELVEGPTLAERISQGALSLDEALAVARQIAEALEAAHEHGIVHRDLKPANIKVRPDGTVKVLDFGLAKAMDPNSSLPSAVSQLPTITTPAMTQVGMILGTAAYMSPEQARGRRVDRRADIWAFGCVLFEMLTGRRAFDAEDVSLTLARVLERDVDMDALPRQVPARVRQVLRLCLQRDLTQRAQAIGDVRLALGGAFESAATTAEQAVPRRTTWLWLVITAAVALSLGGVVSRWLTRTAPASPRVTRFMLVPPNKGQVLVTQNNLDIAISPDGTRVAYRDVLQRQWYLHSTDELAPVPLRLPVNASAPFFSPDGEWLAFNDVGDDTIKRVSIAGGPVLTVGRVGAGGTRGASWGEDGMIVFARSDFSGLWQVPAGGGEPRALTRTGSSLRHRHYWPDVLPGGAGVLFTIVDDANSRQIALADVMTGEFRVLLDGGTAPRYLASGYIAYASGTNLLAVPFDVERRQVVGKPVPMVEGILAKPFGLSDYAAARGGTLAYVAGGATGTTRELVWVTRSGQEEPLETPARAYQYPRLSPDGTRVALDVRDQEADIWTWDIARRTLTRLTFERGGDEYPVWTSDSRRVIFGSGPINRQNLYSQSADGTGKPVRLTESPNDQDPGSITPTGTAVLFRDLDPATQVADIRMLTLSPEGSGGGTASPQALVATRFDERNPEVSPDGRWLAYQSDESGRIEVYVRPFPDVESGKWQVSTAGGRTPLWSPKGDELFFLSDENALWSAQRLPGPVWTNRPPVLVLKGDYFHAPAGGRSYDVSRDGQRFLFIKNRESGSPTSLVVVQNWIEEVKRLVPMP